MVQLHQDRGLSYPADGCSLPVQPHPTLVRSCVGAPGPAVPLLRSAGSVEPGRGFSTASSRNEAAAARCSVRTATGGVLIGLALACGDRESGSGSEVTAGELVAYVATWRETEERVCLVRAGRHSLDVNASEPGVGVLALLSADDGQGRIVAEAEPRGLESPPRSVRSESVNLEAGEPCYRLSVLSGVVAVTATARLVRE